jgi:hypothetical protein
MENTMSNTIQQMVDDAIATYGSERTALMHVLVKLQRMTNVVNAIQQTIDERVDGWQEFNELLTQVQKIDEAAAIHLIEASFDPEFTPSNDLMGCMIWEDTPQGHAYWLNLNERLWRSTNE